MADRSRKGIDPNGGSLNGNADNLLLDGESAEFIRVLEETLRRTGRLDHHQFQRLFDLQERYRDVDQIQRLMAQALVVRQDWDGLVEHYLSLQADKRDHDQLAGAFIKSHRYSEAWDYLSEIVGKDGTSPDRQWLLAVAAVNSDRESEAKQLLDELTSSESSEQRLADIHLLKGQLHYRQTNWQEAESHFRLALAHLPDDIGLHVNLGQALRHLRRDEEAAFFENRAQQLRQVADEQDATRRLMAALSNNLERAWKEKDFPRCMQIISQMEPHADSSIRRVLDEYRREIARTTTP